MATYAHELFSAMDDLDTVYVPIGLGSGICGLIGARDALGLRTEVVGVVSEAANAYFHSFTAGRAVETNSALTFADGMAVRVPDPMALEVIRKGAERVVEVSDDEIAAACRRRGAFDFRHRMMTDLLRCSGCQYDRLRRSFCCRS
jgi:threonine dehydratase